MIALEKDKEFLIKETSKCKACRFCVGACPTYNISDGVESMSAYGRLQIIKYLLLGTLEIEDSLIYFLYSCMQCKKCETICKSRGKDLDICKLIEKGRSMTTEVLLEGRQYV